MHVPVLMKARNQWTHTCTHRAHGEVSLPGSKETLLMSKLPYARAALLQLLNIRPAEMFGASCTWRMMMQYASATQSGAVLQIISTLHLKADTSCVSCR
jgi:hypothetical protein